MFKITGKYDVTQDHFKCLDYQILPGCRKRDSTCDTYTVFVLDNDCDSRSTWIKMTKYWLQAVYRILRAQYSKSYAKIGKSS